MPIEYIFWTLMLIWLVAAFVVPQPYRWTNAIILFLLIGMLGWKVMGHAVK